MNYFSTRDKSLEFNFKDIFLRGLAPGGGLFLPAEMKKYNQEELNNLSQLNYNELATEIIFNFCSGEIKKEELSSLIQKSYSSFKDKEVVNIKKIGNINLLELYHGPTLAFKDIAMQVIGNMYDHLEVAKDKTVNVIVATSGDTGSAAIAALSNRKNINLFVLHPHNKISNIQRKIMTTIGGANIYNIAIEGSFDDCQKIVKELFNEDSFRSKINMSGVNSINWARIVCQIVYYFYSFFKLKKNNISFSVPTGNFGNVFACYSAYKMGLPLKSISVAVNENDILHRFFSNNDYSKHAVLETISPSMDISVASNFERLVYDFFLDRDSNACANLFNSFPSNAIKFDSTIWEKRHEIFLSHKVTDKQTKEIISSHFFETNYLLDPHTAIGIPACIENLDSSNHYVLLATAHPAKFPKLYEELNIDMVDVPSSLMNLRDKEENVYRLNANYDELSNFIKKNNFN